MEHLGVKAAKNLQSYQTNQNLKRLKRAQETSKPVVKAARRQQKRAKKLNVLTQERGEGQTYGAGMLGVGNF
jgi:hypothetical protein